MDLAIYDFVYSYRQVENFRKFELTRFRRTYKHAQMKIFTTDQKQSLRSLITKYDAPLNLKEVVDSTNMESL